MNTENNLTLLGKATEYIQHYSPNLLESLPRSHNREKIHIHADHLPFSGVDLWTGFELSWLNPKGKPMVAIAEFIIPATSSHLIESKSFKLYLNSFNQTKVDSAEALTALLEKDLSLAAGAKVAVILYADLERYPKNIASLPGTCIDHLDIEVDHYELTPAYLNGAISDEEVTETLSSNLLKSNCLVTNQPDWGSVVIHYKGKKIDQEKLLRYLISFRTHNEFHEQCVERIFNDIMRYCQPEKLTVFARYARRGGLDINPFRSNFEQNPTVARLVRQ